MIVNGRAIAQEMLASVRERAAGCDIVVRAVVMQPTAATESYLKIKTAKAREAAMRLELVRMADNATTEEVVESVRLPGANAVIVQLPLPEHIDTQKVLGAIPQGKDADVLGRFAYEAFKKGEADALLPPVVGATAEILSRADINPHGKHIAIIGKGRLVGEPAALWFSRFGGVEVFTRDSNFSNLKDADIVISGAGQAGLIRPDMLKKGVVLIDAGTSESGGTVAGDADPSCADVASVFTPVPGGVGPVAVAYLFKNVASLLG